MTPFSASNQGGMTEANTAHNRASAPSLPAFRLPTAGESSLRFPVNNGSAGNSPAAPRLSLTPFALTAHQAGASAVEDGPVAFSIASSLLDQPTHASTPQPAVPGVTSHPAYDVDLAHFDELRVELKPEVTQALALETPAPAAVPAGQESGLPLNQASIVSPAAASEPALMLLFKSALRRRIIAFGRVPQQRSAQEWVFLMLSFAVMSLLAAPPLVAIFLSLHGVRP